MKDIVIACCRVAQKNPNLIVDEQSKDFWKWRDTILQNEDLLLEVLCFDLTIEAPHKQLYDMLKFYGVHHNKQLRNAAWAFVTDSNQTQLCLISPSRTIAAAALYCAARASDVAFPDNPRGQPWWEVQNVRLKDMLRACTYMAANYEHAPGKAGGPPDGGQSIYVGLLCGAEDSPDGVGHGRGEKSWERTRLKSEFSQAITSPNAAANTTVGSTTASTQHEHDRTRSGATSLRSAASPGNGVAGGVAAKRPYDGASGTAYDGGRGGGAAAGSTQREEEREVKKRRVSPPPAVHAPFAGTAEDALPSNATQVEDKEMGNGDDGSEEGEVEE